ncbi:MAG TPA: 5'-3' exonuclease H3TH domain-containing protein [Candidatus Paceibacterota bacterium]|nr:5'-3' exonuclease H3TH domain-containing protein [Candidatus Paceibacterota bacterium]
MKTLILIDANSIIHRCFHALPKFTAPDGRPSGALYGLASVLLKIFRETPPDYAAALFDRPEPTFRDKMYKEYKAQRPPTENILISQLIEAPRLFEKFGVKPFDKAGFEADDLIATLAEKFKDEVQVIIMTGDMDTLQMVKDGKITVRTFKKGISETMDFDEAAVRNKYGLEPEQLVDYKALVGDASDNVKGVSGIGPKTAAGILHKAGTLENAYANPLLLPEKVREKLLESKEQAELSRRLVLLEKNVPVGDVKLEELKAEMKKEDIKEYFEKFGFRALINRMDNGLQKSPAKVPAKKPKEDSDSKQGKFL